jgi:hypothetical protein
MNPNIIRTISHVDIEGWTWENFTRYVEYESMFFGTAERIDPHTAPHASGERSTAAAVFVLHRSNQGYNGFILSHREYIHLFNPDGAIPPDTKPIDLTDKYTETWRPPTQGG